MEEEAGEGAGLIRLGDPPDEYSEEVAVCSAVICVQCDVLYNAICSV